ncbi:transglutaminase-like domain-containing protein [Paracoccus salsus]|uniref:transglutaminase-like domain-containing protein n=1 Tax=Paracoccus salsus TaxID=2911061 RepID=UPI001F1965AE|nr:transglutaminase-like domain-containing protein [Paracoccus salsus]MCF3972144.1 transglutaminase-like domain-containing protein [Paracoccus salsus]
MRMSIDVELDYGLAEPGPVLLVLEAAGASGQELHRTSIDFGQVDRFARVPAEEGIGERIILRSANRVSCRYSAEVTVTRRCPDLARLSADQIDDMPGDALRYLLPSRYCQAERFTPYVQRHFAQLEGGAKVAAIRDWVEDRLDYVWGVSTPATTAADTFLERQGVCRDYAHLMIALCRAAQIPARIASAYAPSVQPPDFHAVVEVYLQGGWWLVDPTGMAQADTMALIAVGRDATDVAFMTTMSGAELRIQTVRVRSISV